MTDIVPSRGHSSGFSQAGAPGIRFAKLEMRRTKKGKDELVRYSLDLELRNARQRLVVTVHDPLGGATLWGDAEVEP